MLKKFEIGLSMNTAKEPIVHMVRTSTMYLSGMGSFCLIRTMRTMRIMYPVPATTASTASTGDIPIRSVTRYAFYDLNTILHVF